MSLTCGYYTCIYIYIIYSIHSILILGWLTIYRKWSCCLHSILIPNDMKLPTRTSICDSVMISQNGICWMSSFQQTKDGNEVFSKRTTGSSNESHRMRFFKNLSKVEVDMLLQKTCAVDQSQSKSQQADPQTLKKNRRGNVQHVSPRPETHITRLSFQGVGIAVAGLGTTCLSHRVKMTFFGGGFSNVTTWDSERNSDQPPQQRENNMLSQLLRVILQLTRIFLLNVLSWESTKNTLTNLNLHFHLCFKIPPFLFGWAPLFLG